MRWLLPLLLASIATLAVSLTTSPAATPRLPRPVPKVRCERPRTLHLRRFEDRSARLECVGRVIVRVAVPG